MTAEVSYLMDSLVLRRSLGGGGDDDDEDDDDTEISHRGRDDDANNTSSDAAGTAAAAAAAEAGAPPKKKKKKKKDPLGTLANLVLQQVSVVALVGVLVGWSVGRSLAIWLASDATRSAISRANTTSVCVSAECVCSVCSLRVLCLVLCVCPVRA